MGCWDVISAGERADVAKRREQVALGRDVGTDIGQRLHPEAEEFAVLVKGQLGVADIVAGVLVGLDRLAALASPFDRPAQFLRRDQHEPMLRVLPALCAEPAADIAGNDADLAFGNFENTRRQRLAHPVRVLHIGAEGEALLAPVPHADRTARLHEMRIDPADDIAALDDVRRLGEGRGGRGLVAGLEQVRDVVRALIPYRGPSLGRLGGVGDRGQSLVINVDQLGGILRQRQRLRDDKGDRFADIAHRPLSKAEKGASEHRRSVGPLALKRDAHDAELGLDEIVSSHDQRDTWHGQGCHEVELADASMGVRRAQHVSVCLAVQVVVALEAAVAAQEALVLETPHRLADSELTHRSTRSPVAENSCSDQPLQLRVNGAGAILVLLSGAVADPHAPRRRRCE